MNPSQEIRSFFELKWNPFGQDIPDPGLCGDENIDRFVWRTEQIVADGGFAQVTGESGTGKSCSLRYLRDKLSQNPDAEVRLIERPQSGVRDFYREMGKIFGVGIQASNRYSSFEKLREQWLISINTRAFRPVIIIDEAQIMNVDTMSELRIISSTELDARCILAVILAGDARLTKLLDEPELLPIKSRIRAKLDLNARTGESMRTLIIHLLREAGNPSIMTDGVIKALSEQSLGNPRVLSALGNELLLHALSRKKKVIDQDLYFDLYKSSLRKPRT